MEKQNAYNERGGYRKFYQKAALELVKRYREEHKEIMELLGYVSPKAKAQEAKEKVREEAKVEKKV